MIRAVALVVLSAVLAGCAVQPVVLEDVPRTPSYATIDLGSTSLGREVERLPAPDGRKSGFYVLDRGEEALLWRGALIDRAERTVDAQYFIWSEDNVGTIAAERLLRAANRGARVRVLVDDLSLATDPRFLAMLDRHPQIEIRLYNPTGVVGRKFLPKAFSVMGDFYRLNRRMHNKALIVDGAAAIIGGRNIADEYYDMHHEFNFRDRDVLTVGPVVREIAEGFDRYWNSVWSAPVEAFVRADFTEAERNAYYARLQAYAADPKNFPERFHAALAQTQAQLRDLGSRLVWGDARLIYDIPGKNDDVRRLDAFGETGKQLTDAAAQAKSEILAETPYLALMPGTLDLIRDVRSRGVSVRILTNSLAATDNVFAFSRYAPQRAPLLRQGVELHEIMTHPQYLGEIVTRLPRMAVPAHLALHAKTMVIDRRIVFIGSFNMDPRSTHLNTEMGVLIDSRELAAQVAAAIERDMDPANSWKVTLAPDDGRLTWSWVADGRAQSTHSEPEADAGSLLQLMLFSLMPVDRLI